MSAVVPATADAPAAPVLPRRASSWVVAGRLARLLATRTAADASSWLLPVVALAVVSALTLTVAGGIGWFLRIPGEEGALYQFLATIAGILLVLPMATLASAAARLAALRRDTRLSSLRLLGATTTTVRVLALAETSATALAGALLGVLGYVVLMPVVGLIPFRGAPIGAAGLWLGPLPLLATVAAIVALTTASAALGLRRVEISPLGVRTRAQAPRMSWTRLLAGGAALVAAAVLAAAVQIVEVGVAVLMVMTLVSFALPLLALNVLGPWLVARVARGEVRRARTPVALLAARSVLDDPRQAWRQASGLAMVSFVAVFLAAGMAVAGGTPMRPEDAVLLADTRTGVLLTLFLAFLTTACSVGVTQASAILDRRGLHVGLAMLGMPLDAIDAARRRAVMRPLLLVVGLAVAAGLVVVLPLLSQLRGADLVAPVVLALVLAAGLAVIRGSLWLTRGVLRQVVAGGIARTE